jgi:carbon monoxide dehydrogenase subunit G
MIETRNELRVARPAAAVWKVASDFAGIGAWFPGLTDVKVEGSGIGAMRHATGRMGTVRERLVAHDSATMTFSYSITAGAPMGDHLATVKVTPDGADACIVVWTSRFKQLADIPAEKMKAGVEKAYAGALAALAAKA